jgi:hypothetical protein
MKNDHYNMSFTTGGLFLRESIEVAEMYLQDPDWETVRERALEENVLQFRKISSAKRSLQEVLKRLWHLEEEELEFLVNTTPKNQKQLLWIAICKTYRFIRDFAVEVIRDKFLKLDMEIGYSDFDIFYFNKAEQDPHLEELTELTRKKCRTVLFQIMREVEIITVNGLIIPTMFSYQLIDVIKDYDSEYLYAFPITEGDIQRLLSNESK